MGERLQSTNSTMVMAGTSGIAAVVSLPTTTVASISASATARALSARGEFPPVLQSPYEAPALT